ncbi:MAG: patatin-like phospholipase family protein [Xanthomonadales bacterium]|nr:patatin-like phospholipase family protein [Xanthomonadales bacterium]
MTQATINLALQGGGAHGAFTWGALDALLEDGRIGFDGLSGTSAGAMNAVVMAAGWLQDGRDGARQALADFWQGIASKGVFWNSRSDSNSGLFDWPGRDLFTGAGNQWLEAWSSFVSPYQFNPFNINPLRDLLTRQVDFQALSQPHCLKLYICATNVRSGKIRIFDNAEISLDTLLASACLPQLFRAVEIDGEAYWDGGYMGNPALYPLYYNTPTRDIVVVHVNPIRREEVPRNPAAIATRVNEISFNSSLMREMRAIEFAARMVEEGWLKDEYRSRLRHVLIHSIRDDVAMAALDGGGKLAPDLKLLHRLRDLGRDAALAWLAAHRGDIGKRSSVDLRAEFL